MLQEDLAVIVERFFSCDNENILRIIEEFLHSASAEEGLSLDELMSRNYETAQANPEIKTIPGNLKDARDAIFPYFWGTDGWFSKLHLENVKGPANYASLIGSIACLLKNPNLCVDTYSQRSNELEVKAITTLANLVFYNIKNPWGVFTMGGTVSNMYAGKIGIEKMIPGAMHKGIRGTRLAGIVSQAAHYSNETLAGWLGLGTDNLHAIPVDRHCAMRMDLLQEKLEELYNKKILVPFVIATFGCTDTFGIDDVAAIRRILDNKAKKYKMPLPHLHVDAAAGWALCLLNEYDTGKNLFKLHSNTVRTVDRLRKRSIAMRYADSVTVDMHKMGWGHYPSSAFIVNDRDDLKLLNRSKEAMPYFCEADYRRDPALFTLECSRPALGPYSVMASLNGIGLKGYQLLVAHALEMTNLLKEKLMELPYCKVLNDKSMGPSVVWWVLPKGRNARRIFQKFEKGQLKLEDQQAYFKEIEKMFDKRVKGMDSRIDARLSFTTSIGYCPHDQHIPAWKAVFFNPKTDEVVVNQIVRSIKEL